METHRRGQLDIEHLSQLLLEKIRRHSVALPEGKRGSDPTMGKKGSRKAQERLKKGSRKAAMCCRREEE